MEVKGSVPTGRPDWIQTGGVSGGKIYKEKQWFKTFEEARAAILNKLEVEIDCLSNQIEKSRCAMLEIKKIKRGLE